MPEFHASCPAEKPACHSGTCRCPLNAELNARRAVAAAVLAAMDDLLAALGRLLDDSDDGELDDDDGEPYDDDEPYCAECGALIGMFIGLTGWHHFRGDPAPGGQRELYDAGHEAAVAWRPADPAGGSR